MAQFWNDINPFSSQGNFGNTLDDLSTDLRGYSDKLGITHQAPPDPAQGPDAQAERDYATTLRQQYANLAPGQAPQAQFQALDQTQANQARGVANNNLSDLQGVASGARDTAADAMFRQGTDQAARNATGIAAANSRQNPGLALRTGLAASNAAYAQATGAGAAEKANEQAQARGQLGSLADAVRGQDLTAAAHNQAAFGDTQKANQAAALQQQQIDNQHQLGLGNLASSTTIAPINASIANQQIQAATNASNQQGIGGAITAVGNAVSDERAKSGVKETSLADALGQNVKGVTYRYRPGIEDGSAHEGVLAQDLEKVFPGAVGRGGDGLKRVDTSHLSLGLAGITAELARRLKAVEARR